MKLLLTVVALAAFTQASPITTNTMEIGASGVQSGSVLNNPLVEIIVNKIKNAAEAVVPETVNEPVLGAEPVIVVDEAQNQPEPGNPIDVISINPILPQPEVVPAPVLPAPGNPIDVISVNPVVPQPEVVPAPVLPAPGNPIDVISVNPVAPQPQDVPAPIVLPEPTPAEFVPAPIVLPEPTPAEVVPAPIVLPEPTPVEVVPSPIVLPEPTPAEVVPAPIVLPEPAPAEVNEGEFSYATSSPTINVMMNFIFGNSNTLSST